MSFSELSSATVERAGDYQDRLVQQLVNEIIASERRHACVVLWRKNDEIEERTTPAVTRQERQDYIEDELRINLDSTPYATGYYDHTKRKWEVCGNDAELKQVLSEMTPPPRPEEG